MWLRLAPSCLGPAAAVLLLALAQPAGAQGLPADPRRPEVADPAVREQRELELKRIEQELRDASAARVALAREVERLRGDRAALAAELIETSNRVRRSETALAEADGRLAAMSGTETAIRRSLEGRRGVITEVLAALQRAGRKSPPAVVVRSEDMLLALRTAMLLGAVLPELRDEAEALAADLAELVRLRQDIAAEHRTIRTEHETLVTARQRLSALVEARQGQIESGDQRLVEERQRTLALARQAQSLKELIARMETEITAARRAAEAARNAPPPLQTPAQVAALAPGLMKDLARLQPRIPFADARGTLPLPVNGGSLRGFGAPDGFGGQERGLSLGTPQGALVTAPADGWVAFAGPYRAYGHVLIINAGGGYHLVMAGMDRVSVEIGQFVLAGEPVAVMGSGAAGAVVDAEGGAGKPVLYIELRKDGSPIDPGPWWAKPSSDRPDNEKARG